MSRVNVILMVFSLGCISFIVINWSNVGYGWTAYFSLHWIVSFLLMGIWSLLFFREKKHRSTLSYLSITILLFSVILDLIWLQSMR